MQISLKLIWGINHAKSIVCIKFQLLVTFTGSPITVFVYTTHRQHMLQWHNFSISTYVATVLYVANQSHRNLECVEMATSEKRKWVLEDRSSVFRCCHLDTFEISMRLDSEIKCSGEIQWNWVILPPRHKTPLRYKPIPLTTWLYTRPSRCILASL